MDKGLSKLLTTVSTLIITTFFIFYVSAQQTLTKSYNIDTKTVTISSSGNTLAEIQLISNTDQCLIDCEAVIRIKPYATLALPSASNDNFRWDFVKARSDQQGLDSYNFEILVAVPYSVSDYSRICNPYSAIAENSSSYTIENCTIVETGLRTLYRDEYKPFPFWGSTFESGKDYYIKLKGKKYASLGENDIEWIPTFYGLKLNEFAWWNNDWSRKRLIQVSSNNTIYNLTLPINFNTSAEVSQGDMMANCSDVRFINGSENQELNFWLEGGCNTANTQFWVRIPYVQANVTYNSYIYYAGNATTPSASNKTNTFIWYDDFESSRLDPQWSNAWDSDLGISFVINSSSPINGSYSIEANDTNSGGFGRRNHTFFQRLSNEYMLEFKWKPISGGGGSGTSSNLYIYLFSGTYGNFLGFAQKNGDANNFQRFSANAWAEAITHTANVVYHVKVFLRMPQSNWNIRINETLYDFNGTTNTGGVTALDFLEIQYGTDMIVKANLDDFLLYGWTLPAPTYQIGGEQNRDANETEGDQAIVDGIVNALGPSATIYTDQIIYTRNLTNNQSQGTFDRVASSGNQRWAFNYVTSGETFKNVVNITPSFYVLEMANRTASNITNTVALFINSTKA